jgi:hypothetical protein
MELGLGMLINGGDPHVQGRTLQARRPFFFGARPFLEV